MWCCDSDRVISFLITVHDQVILFRFLGSERHLQNFNLLHVRFRLERSWDSFHFGIWKHRERNAFIYFASLSLGNLITKWWLILKLTSQARIIDVIHTLTSFQDREYVMNLLGDSAQQRHLCNKVDWGYGCQIGRLEGSKSPRGLRIFFFILRSSQMFQHLSVISRLCWSYFGVHQSLSLS